MPVMKILSIEKIGRSLPDRSTPTPFQGCIDSPKSVESFDQYTLQINGWALINGVPVQFVDVFLDGKLVRTATAKSLRPDIPAHFQLPKEIEKCGFRFMVGALSSLP